MKQIERKDNMKLIVKIGTIGMVLVVLFSSLVLSKNYNDKINHYDYFESIKIYPGDTLEAICEEVMDKNNTKTVTLKQQMKATAGINNIDPDHITYGNYIIVPVYK